MTDAREIIARQIEPQAWAALGKGDTLAYKNRRTSSDRKAIRIIQNLAAAGFRILGPDEVQAIRDEALEEAAKEVEDELVDIYEDSPDIDIECNNLVRRAAASIRSLKGGRNV